MPLIVGFDGLRFRQPPNRIGTLRVGCCLDAVTSIEAFQPEVESIKGTQELAEFFPSVLAPIHDDRRRAFALIDSSVYRSTVQVESILTGPGAWKIGGAKVSYPQTGLYLLDELGLRLSDRHLRRLENKKLVAARTIVHPLERLDAETGAHMNDEVERMLLAH
jgi:hypothetical protein